ncbi:MAG: hypothetical protein ACWA5W_03390 [Phycisphaerales bacterium]
MKIIASPQRPTRFRSAALRRGALCVLALAGVGIAPLVGCNAIRGGGGSGGSSTIRSDANKAIFKASFPIKAYTYHDDNTADIYLTDLSDADLTTFFAPKADWSTISGTLVQIHLFLDPKPGKTPIEPTAATASIRYGIIVDGEVGIYDGAGFMLPGSKPGNDSIGGTIRSAPLRITRATPGFQDVFEAARIDLEFSANLDPDSAPELQARLDAMAAKAMPVRD